MRPPGIDLVRSSIADRARAGVLRRDEAPLSVVGQRVPDDGVSGRDGRSSWQTSLLWWPVRIGASDAFIQMGSRRCVWVERVGVRSLMASASTGYREGGRLRRVNSCGRQSVPYLRKGAGGNGVPPPPLSLQIDERREAAESSAEEVSRMSVRSRLHNVSKPGGESGGAEWTAGNERSDVTARGSSG